ncbi:hypothetical protein [Nocardia seriolae]|uniref:hypothetical protein n=1 Tax=Nocardia seriolae TaxID=37332 RepID=UPI000A3FD536
MLARSFVRPGPALYETADQVRLAIRDEVVDLEKAGIAIIQVDEPSIRELLPLRKKGQAEYLRWAVGAFKLATSGVKPETQIHTHIGYSSRGDVVAAIEELDADVTRHRRDPLHRVGAGGAEGGLRRGPRPHPRVGPGVYESRSARIPDIDELDELLTPQPKPSPRNVCGRTRTAVSRPATTGSWTRPCAIWSRPPAASAAGPRPPKPPEPVAFPRTPVRPHGRIGVLRFTNSS